MTPTKIALLVQTTVKAIEVANALRASATTIITTSPDLTVEDKGALLKRIEDAQNSIPEWDKIGGDASPVEK